jgi:hypothetical protein
MPKKIFVKGAQALLRHELRVLLNEEALPFVDKSEAAGTHFLDDDYRLELCILEASMLQPLAFASSHLSHRTSGVSAPEQITGNTDK